MLKTDGDRVAGGFNPETFAQVDFFGGTGARAIILPTGAQFVPVFVERHIEVCVGVVSVSVVNLNRITFSDVFKRHILKVDFLRHGNRNELVGISADEGVSVFGRHFAGERHFLRCNGLDPERLSRSNCLDCSKARCVILPTGTQFVPIFVERDFEEGERVVSGSIEEEDVIAFGETIRDQVLNVDVGFANVRELRSENVERICGYVNLVVADNVRRDDFSAPRGRGEAPNGPRSAPPAATGGQTKRRPPCAKQGGLVWVVVG